MKRVISVSLGSSKGNKSQETEILGEKFLIERIGTDGNLEKFAQMFLDLDGKVDALGVGGADIYLVVGNKRYVFKQIERIVSKVKMTPVVDGSGLKHTLEREAVRTLQREGTIDFKNSTTLMVAAVDRFGMAQALEEIGGQVIFGDLMFGLGLPIPLRSYKAVRIFGSLILPIITRLPSQWFYPTGDRQTVSKPKFPKIFAQSQVIAGDKHIIFRNMPSQLQGKTLLTQTLRKADFEILKKSGCAKVITTTPVMGGETFATNVMEGVLVALSGKRPDELRDSDYLDLLSKLQWKPNVVALAS